MKAENFLRTGAWRLCLVLLVAAWCTPDADAAPIRWREKNFTYVAQNKNLREFLREFGASQGLTVVVSSEIEGTLNGKFSMSPQSMLELVAATYSVIWYYDGNVLFIYPSSDADTAIIRSSRSNIDELKATIARLGIADPKYPITYDATKDVAIVSGPKRYIELVRQTMQAVDANDSGRVESGVQVFRLKYAWAGDHEFRQGGRTYTIPGVATVLQRLHAQGPRGTQRPSNPVRADGMTSLQKLRAMGLVGKDGKMAGSAVDYNALLAGMNDQAGVIGDMERGSAGGPQFEADGRLNAVVVRDAPARMAYHRAVIEALDVRPALVEIEARIIEVSSDVANSLGIDWRLRTARADFQFSNERLPVLSRDGFIAPDAPPASTAPGAPDLRGGLLTAITGDSTRYLIARVKALSQEGKANILSSPKVTTLDNVEAVIENLQTFFVRVAGHLDVGLYDVSAGTSLRVTPLVVKEKDGAQIKLAVRIEDGRVDRTSAVDQIPVINRSTISSESFVRSGESLLIAGYATESDTDDRTGIPGLSKVPVLGKLFGHTERRKVKVERLFMLTPRLVVPQ